jgi:hypothetical protein
MEVRVDGVKYVPVPDAPADKGLLAALEVRFDSDAGDDLTVRDYLRTLLMTLWEEGEGFSGKRPFGNSGWEYDIYKPLIAGGFIPGALDEDGYVNTVDDKIAGAYVCDLILAAFHGVHEG